MPKTRLSFLLACFTSLLFACAQVKEPETDSDQNNDPAGAIIVTSFPSTLAEYIDHPEDEDFYKFNVPAYKRIWIDLSIPDGKNYGVYLLDSNERTKDSSVNGSTGGVKQLRYQALFSGPYYIKVNSGNGAFSTSIPYRLTVHVTDSSGAPGYASPHLILGNPSKAANATDSTDNYLMEKSPFAMSYNSTGGRPNWVSWQLNASWLGTVPRQNNFRSDVSLPAGWYHVGENDFSGSGYDRGHMCPSGDRTATESDNAETFLMTNMIAQAPDNNQGPWANLESYCRGLVNEGKGLFIISGGYGYSGTLASGHVRIPDRTWKVIVVLNEPNIGLAGVNTATRVIAVDMPNINGIRNANWKNYRVSVDQIEAATGYDFLSNVSLSVQNVIESIIDNQ